MLTSFFFFFLLLSSSSFLHSTATYSRRLLLHHTLLPLSTATSQPPPQNQSVTQTPLPKPFFPDETPPQPPPPPPFRSAGVTLPANISDLILPHPPSPKHFSKTLILITVALLSTALFSILTLVFYCQSRRRYAAVKAQRSDGLRLYPANTTTSDGGRKPGDASLRGSDFLYLGTVVSSQQQGEVRGAVPNSSVALGMQSASSGYQKLGSPELHPLPPLPRQVFRSGCLSEGEMEDDGDEFFSPRGSLGGGRASPATTDPNDKVEVFKDEGVQNLLRKFSGARSTSSSPSSSWASSNSASLGSNKSKSPGEGAKWPPLALSPPPPSPLNRRNGVWSSQSPLSPCSSPSSSSQADSGTRSQHSRGSEDRRGVSDTRAISNIHVESIPPAPPPPPPPVLGQQRREQASTVAGVPICEPVQESLDLMGENGDRDKREEGQRPKLKALHWDKVRASSDRAMVWDQLKSSSFQLNEEMIETLFVVNGSGGGGSGGRGSRGKENVQVEHRVALDQRKSHNIAILLKALNVTNDEVCEALLEGNVESLGAEVLENLIKMAPSKEEEVRLKGFKEEDGESGVRLGAAERFLRDVIHIPFAFKRINAMLYMANFDTEVEYLITSFDTLEAACEELRKSRKLLKVLEAVLKTGNRMNVGTNRGDALAFKLDTLLKLVDVKGGGDGKTTLLHFVVQEMMAREEKLVAAEDEEVADGGEMRTNTRGKRGVEGLSRELMNVKKAAAMDSEVLRGDVVRVLEGIGKVEEVVELNDSGEGGWWYSCKLSESMKGFLREGRDMVRKVEVKERGAMSVVRETTEYFHGDSAKEEAHPLRIFMVVRDFLSILDRVCSEVKGGKMKEHRFVTTSATPTPPHHPHSGSEVDG